VLVCTTLNCCLCESLNAFVLVGVGSSDFIEEEQDVGLVSLGLSPLINVLLMLLWINNTVRNSSFVLLCCYSFVFQEIVTCISYMALNLWSSSFDQGFLFYLIFGN